MYKEYPTWIEVKEPIRSEHERYNLCSSHELVLDPQGYYVYFYYGCTKLLRQEYYFLLRILKKNGKKISDKKLIKEINSKANPEKYNTTLYKIKSHIKSKLKKVCPKYYLVDECDWAIIDKSYESQCSTERIINFIQSFELLISKNKEGYFTYFVQAKLLK